MKTIVLCFAGLWMAVSAWAGVVPSQITYQGTLKQSGVAANGTYTMTFRLTDNGGLTQYWSSGPMPVTVSQGLFSALLSPTGVDWQNVTPYIEVNVSGQVLLPREPVTSTAYALMCGSVANETGMIAMFAEICPSGWTRFGALDGVFPMGGAAYGATGGSATHSHSMGGPSSTDTGVVFSSGQGSGSFLSDWGRAGHRHSVSAESNLPPYLTVVFCQKQ